ncbi:hypothetical protein CU097_006141 [Rhizopus azygosporus]|uniref:Velvet domain-containing protein n=1 Tax=Rhizopus azygosporus TaxID=86630 RepID=A0A367JHT0_RHIAZ|nr:hypothetical protein CU097_006141 [Rhizopus azygosporus]
MVKLGCHKYVPACPKSTENPSRYILNVSQQPIQARISTNNERDRKPIDPPPIVQISLADPSSPQEIDNLCHPTNDEEIYTPTHNALCGQTVSSMFKLNDIDNQYKAFFIFGDLSVKVEGNYRLKLSLFQITETGAICLSSIFTNPFTVYSAKAFPGHLESTFLSKTFSDQGARIKIRKENRAPPVNLRKRKSIPNTERRNSVTSHSSIEESPVLMNPPLPRVTLPPLSPLDKMYPSPLYVFDLKLPPLQLKRTKIDNHEQNAAVAMMQLSQHVFTSI